MLSKQNSDMLFPLKSAENTHSKINLVYPCKLYKYFSYKGVYSALPVFPKVWIQSNEK